MMTRGRGAYPAGEPQNQPFQLSFNPTLKIKFQGSRVTSDGGLILVRELDERLGAAKTSAGQSINVGVITDMTGALSFLGIANANVAKMVINDINAKGGLLGRQTALYLEDSATTDSIAEAKAKKLVQQDQVDVILGGIYSSTRQAIKGPAVADGKKLYIYSEQYEGQECHPLIFCTGPGASAAG